MAPQANSIVTTIPSAIPLAGTLYLPEIHSRTGNYFPELRLSDMTRDTVVADIASAQHDDVIRVIAIDLTSKRTWDASEEIARDVLDNVLSEYGHAPNWCENFLEEHLGVGFVARAHRSAA